MKAPDLAQFDAHLREMSAELRRMQRRSAHSLLVEVAGDPPVRARALAALREFDALQRTLGRLAVRLRAARTQVSVAARR